MTRRFPSRLLLVGLATVCAAVIGLVRSAEAHAHPLGNFTINHYSGIEVAGDKVYIRQILDLAEIPAFQLADQVTAPGYARQLGRELGLQIDGRPIPLVVVSSRATRRPGAGGLFTLRFEAVYRAEGRPGALSFRDRSFPDRIGWHEVTIRGREGARVERASVPEASASRELRAYPQDLLRSPLDVRGAQAAITPGTADAAAPVLGAEVAPVASANRFEALIGRGQLSFGIVLIALAVAAFWGAAHALTPGHGKALVAGYLIGTRGRPRDALLLGATVTVTHTAGVFALGFVTLALSQFIVPEQLYPWVTLISGLLVVAVGLGVLRGRLRRGAWSDHRHDHGPEGAPEGERTDAHHEGHRAARGHHHHDQHAHHHHHHDHARGHHHDHHDTRLERRGVIGVGIAAGLLPCPSALVVLLSAIALHRVGFGIALIVAFSVGLAATITGIGLVAVLARRAFSRISLEGRLVSALPAASAAVIVAVGLVLTVRAVPAVL